MSIVDIQMPQVMHIYSTRGGVFTSDENGIVKGVAEHSQGFLDLLNPNSGRVVKRPPTPTYKVGDTVILKSGGPTMTVQAIETDNLLCAWLVDDKTPGAAIFNAETVVPAVGDIAATDQPKDPEPTV